jgi:hypothetical protein
MSYEKQLDPASRLDYIRKELLKNYDFLPIHKNPCVPLRLSAFAVKYSKCTAD